MPTTFTKIASVSVGVLGASTIDFTSIPSTYTDLCLKVSYREVFAASFLTPNIYLNGVNTGTSYSGRRLEGNGASAGSASYSSGAKATAENINAGSSTASTFTSAEIYIPNYAGSNNKSWSMDIVTENNATTSFAELHASLFSNTSAINRVTLEAPSSFVQYSTAVLYGIKNS
jgi:hypothetical protein